MSTEHSAAIVDNHYNVIR